MMERLPDRQLDLCGTPCPLNFIRCRLTLETMASGQCLQVDLDPGEPEEMVVSGLRRDGHQVHVERLSDAQVRLKVICAGN
ncbi:sulfurtransferase TusA family protein [Synechococcus sp. UW179A]|uniref:sulfurtransferase TusA family protein n=1 Tax=Synechococcus sp. UW179A TaxID=2575510 RepID=UPI000E0E9027|nr:sulfurtransferase TusA family protein [Synechococcus sp. UW179A]